MIPVYNRSFIQDTAHNVAIEPIFANFHTPSLYKNLKVWFTSVFREGEVSSTR